MSLKIRIRDTAKDAASESIKPLVTRYSDQATQVDNANFGKITRIKAGVITVRMSDNSFKDVTSLGNRVLGVGDCGIVINGIIM